MTTFKEDGGSCTAHARWNPTTGVVDVTVDYSIRDWKERLPCPQLPVVGKPDLIADCRLGATFGQEEYWGVNPVTGVPVIDYGAVFGTLSLGILEKRSGKPLPSSLQLLKGCTRAYAIKRGGKEAVDEHWIDVGGDFFVKVVCRLKLARKGQVVAPPTRIVLACEDDDW